jgi:hypothetical protein
MIDMPNPTFKEFCKKPEIKLSDWTEGYQWGLLGKKILKYKKDDKSLFCFTAGANISILIRKLATSIFRFLKI